MRYPECALSQQTTDPTALAGRHREGPHRWLLTTLVIVEDCTDLACIGSRAHSHMWSSLVWCLQQFQDTEDYRVNETTSPIATMPPTASIDNDKISFNSTNYDLIDRSNSPVSALEDGTYNSHLTTIEKTPSRNTELRQGHFAFQIV